MGRYKNSCICDAFDINSAQNTRKKTKEFPLTKECLSCICEAISGCDQGMNCVPVENPSPKNATLACGPFRIYWPLWYDAERPTPDGINPESDEAFQACTLDYDCSIRTVKHYIENHSQDCDGDHKIDCNDYGRIVKMGGYHCDDRPNELFMADLNACLTKSKITRK